MCRLSGLCWVHILHVPAHFVPVCKKKFMACLDPYYTICLWLSHIIMTLNIHNFARKQYTETYSLRNTQRQHVFIFFFGFYFSSRFHSLWVEPVKKVGKPEYLGKTTWSLISKTSGLASCIFQTKFNSDGGSHDYYSATLVKKVFLLAAGRLIRNISP